MNKLMTFIAAVAVSFTAIASNPSGDEKKYKVNTAESEISWLGKKVTGEHFGKLSFKDGWLNLEKEAITNAEFVANMESITVEDMKGEYAEKLRGHLLSKDFFDVEMHKTSSFKLNAFKKEQGDTYNVSGSLTIKGISHPISFPAKLKFNEDKVVMRGEFTFDRSLYDVRYGSGKFFEGLGDKTIYDDVKMSFILVAEK